MGSNTYVCRKEKKLGEKKSLDTRFYQINQSYLRGIILFVVLEEI